MCNQNVSLRQHWFCGEFIYFCIKNMRKRNKKTNQSRTRIHQRGLYVAWDFTKKCISMFYFKRKKVNSNVGLYKINNIMQISKRQNFFCLNACLERYNWLPFHLNIYLLKLIFVIKISIFCIKYGHNLYLIFEANSN